jgi:hypothetical protein
MKPRSFLKPATGWIVGASLGAVLVAALVMPARADEHEDRRRPAPPALPATPPADIALWREECGACHVAYPARLLPAADWSRIMRTLDRHFGTDASLDAASAARIEAYLLRAGSTRTGSTRVVASAAGTNWTVVPNLPRITTQRWFLREHDEIPASTWKDKRVGSAARCDACHVNAAQGKFDEHDIRRLP